MPIDRERTPWHVEPGHTGPVCTADIDERMCRQPATHQLRDPYPYAPRCTRCIRQWCRTENHHAKIEDAMVHFALDASAAERIELVQWRLGTLRLEDQDAPP